MPNQPPAGDAELPIKDLILELLGACGRLSTEQITNLVNLIGKREQAQREVLINQLNAKADQLEKIIDNYSIHAARGYPKGTLARRGLKKRIRIALHQLKGADCEPESL